MIGPKAIKDLSPSERERVVGRSRPDIESVKSTVARIVDDVRGRGDAAVIEYTARLDGIRLEPHQLLVGKEEIKAARQSVPRAVVRALERSVRNVRRFHEAQLRPGEWMIEVERGVRVGRARRPIASVGLYVPGGRAAYPSTVVMLAVPARVAGVERTVMCTPPARDGSVNPATLVAADLAGVDAIYRIGGAQAIAAMAFGTETVEKVDKIVGPGNIYVAAAKSLVYGYVDTDLPAGPSEVLILADGTAEPEYVALDLISQAEHDPNAAAVLVTTDRGLAERVSELVAAMAEREERSEIIHEALERNGAILIADEMEEAIAFVNEYSPEHLEIMTEDPLSVIGAVRHAGSVLAGPSSPAAAGDYATGANHVLPTGGMARVRGGLSVEDFVKYLTVQAIDEEGLRALWPAVSALAEAEGLPAHAKAVKRRLGHAGRS